MPTPRPLLSIGREGVCRSAEAGPKDQPGRQREHWAHQPPQQDVPTWGGGFVSFTAVPQDHSGQSMILAGWMNESLKGTRSLKREGEETKQSQTPPSLASKALPQHVQPHHACTRPARVPLLPWLPLSA